MPKLPLHYKVLVIASNAFGRSSKEIVSSPPSPLVGAPPGTPQPSPGTPPLTNECAGAVPAPVTVGNCAGHCIEVSVNGTLLEFTAKETTAAVLDSFYLDVSGSSPLSGAGITFDFIHLGKEVGLGATVPIGSYSTPKVTLSSQSYACIIVSSYRYFDSSPGNFFDSYITKKIILP
ncbi:hypothetical protein JWG44_12425 [Leptospira sp. 201903071]|uniref:hypothetical protein n=1 Tax=Leptospira ainazelensis TaxID=2810034 RepID=UPI0019628EBE|nr:hypothetical protein [Leptospira ainazelensis]MBM9501058.1 hypothetical protein [Leptospira ainazelensis]